MRAGPAGDGAGRLQLETALALRRGEREGGEERVAREKANRAAFLEEVQRQNEALEAGLEAVGEGIAQLAPLIERQMLDAVARRLRGLMQTLSDARANEYREGPDVLAAELLQNLRTVQSHRQKLSTEARSLNQRIALFPETDAGDVFVHFEVESRPSTGSDGTQATIVVTPELGLRQKLLGLNAQLLEECAKETDCILRCRALPDRVSPFSAVPLRLESRAPDPGLARALVLLLIIKNYWQFLQDRLGHTAAPKSLALTAGTHRLLQRGAAMLQQCRAQLAEERPLGAQVKLLDVMLQAEDGWVHSLVTGSPLQVTFEQKSASASDKRVFAAFPAGKQFAFRFRFAPQSFEFVFELDCGEEGAATRRATTRPTTFRLPLHAVEETRLCPSPPRLMMATRLERVVLEGENDEVSTRFFARLHQALSAFLEG